MPRTRTSMNLSVHINRSAAIHYIIAAIVFSLYGGRVCPFLETITLWQASLYSFVTFALMYIARLCIIKQQVNLTSIFQEIAIFAVGSIGLSLWYYQYYDFPLESNIKVVFGMICLGILTSIDLSTNTVLADLNCSVNQLTTLDVSQTLQNLACSVNQLTTLDLSQNTSLIGLVCEFNPLTCLNVKNGNNANLGWIYANDLPNLICIEVDDVAFSTTNWTVIDPQTSFSTDCGNSCSSIWTDIEETNLTNFSLYPNPTTGNFTIDLGETFTDVKTTLTNSLGQVILTENYTLTNFINLDINTPKGIYFLQIVSNGESKTIRIIKT